MVARRGHNPRTRCRHGIPRMVRLGSERLGDGRHHPLSLWNAVELHRFHRLSRPLGGRRILSEKEPQADDGTHERRHDRAIRLA